LAEKRKVVFDLSALSGPELQQFKQDAAAKAKKFVAMVDQATDPLREQLKEELGKVLTKLVEAKREAGRRAEQTAARLPSPEQMQAIATGVGRMAAEQAQRTRDGFMAYVADALNGDKPRKPKPPQDGTP
jgi:hypothetical protein